MICKTINQRRFSRSADANDEQEQERNENNCVGLNLADSLTGLKQRRGNSTRRGGRKGQKREGRDGEHKKHGIIDSNPLQTSPFSMHTAVPWTGERIQAYIRNVSPSLFYPSLSYSLPLSFPLLPLLSMSQQTDDGVLDRLVIHPEEKQPCLSFSLSADQRQFILCQPFSARELLTSTITAVSKHIRCHV